MDSKTLVTVHIIVVSLFLLIYLVKTILIFTNTQALQRFSQAIKVPEMIISTLFLITGIWLFVLLSAIKTLQIVKLACVIISIPVAVIAFKRMNKMLALLSFLLILASYGLAEMAKKQPYLPNKVIVNDKDHDLSQSGLQTYAANCAMCHGMDGKKGYRQAADLTTSVVDQQAVISFVTYGSTGKMPAFSGTLSEQEIRAVSDYVLTLKTH